jgi:hypothetical protein
MRCPAAYVSLSTKALAVGLACLGLAWPRSSAAQLPPSGCVRKTGGTQVVNVPSVEITPEFRLNGEPFPGPSAGVASFTLWASRPRDSYDGPQVELGRSDEPPAPVRVVAGVYDVYYTWVSGADVPRNQYTRLLRGVVLQSSRVLRVNVPMVQVQGEKRHNGAPFENGGSAALRLLALDRPGEVPLGGTLPTEFSVRVIPGRYAVEYDWAGGADLPQNRKARVRTLSLVKATHNVVVNVKSVVQAFGFLHNGEAFPASAYDRGDLVLARGEREEVGLGSTDAGGAVLRVIPGAYTVRWRYLAGAGVPRNKDGLVARGLVVDGTPRMIDVPSVQIEGDYLVGGEPTPGSAYESARLLLVVPGTADEVELGRTHYGGYSMRVLPRSYDVVYVHETGANYLPRNPRSTLLRGWRVGAQPNRAIDIPVGRYAGAFRWNGGDFPSTAYAQGHVYLVPLDREGDPALLGTTSYGVFDRLLLPGRYRAAFARDTGAQLPWNTFTTFGPVVQIPDGVAAGPADAVVDVPSGPVVLQYTHNGSELAAGGPDIARVHFRRDGNSLPWLDSEYGPTERNVVGGRFDLFYQYVGRPGLPRNPFMRIGCWDLDP